MSDLNLPPDAEADHSGPVADPDSFGGDQDDPKAAAGRAGEAAGDDEGGVPSPGTVPPAD